MVKLCFMRWRGKHRPYGYIADMPFSDHQKNAFVDPFFIVQIDEKAIPRELLGDQSVRLDLPKLQGRYKDSTEQYEDEDGEVKERTIHGCFSELGRSNDANPPVITMEDVLYG